MIKIFKRWLDRHAELQKQVEEEISAIEALTVEDAFNRAIDHIQKYPSDFEITLNESNRIPSLGLDPLTKQFFERYEEVYVIQGDARLRIFDELNTGRYLVCKCSMDDVEYSLENGGPSLVESKHKEEEPDRIKSIFHLILMSL